MGRVAGWGSLVALIACNGAGGTLASTDAAALPSPTDSAGSVHDSSEDATLSDGDGGDDADPGAPPPWGPDPPKTPCDADADPATRCASPPSVCADSRWGVAYVTGVCVAGWCQWNKVDIDCNRVAGTCHAVPTLDAGQVDAEAGSPGGIACQGPALPIAPSVACDEDASVDAALCAPPPSVCINPQWLGYYDNGACGSGQCYWSTLERYCPSGCFHGACGSSITAPAPN